MKKLKYLLFRTFSRRSYDLMQAQLQDLREAQRCSLILKDHYSLPPLFPIMANHESWTSCSVCLEVFDARAWVSCPNCHTKPF